MKTLWKSSFIVLATIAIVLPVKTFAAVKLTSTAIVVSSTALETNGRSYNGRPFNGRSYNGIRYNGRGYNGRGFNGDKYEGSVFTQSDPSGLVLPLDPEDGKGGLRIISIDLPPKS